MADLAGNVPSPVETEGVAPAGTEHQAEKLAEWGARIFGDAGDTEWPVEEDAVLGERNGVLAWIEYGLARGASRTLSACPDALRPLAVSALSRFAKTVTPRRSAAARRFISTAYPELSARKVDRRVLTAWKHFFHIAMASEEVQTRLLGQPLADHFDFEICPEVQDLLEQQSGCLFVTGHIGHWEIAPGVLSALGFRSLYVVGKPAKNRPVSQRVQRMREKLGVRVLPRHGAMRAIPKVLRTKGHVAMLLDQRAHLKPVIAPFFGRPACCDRSAAVLIRRLKVPIVVGCCFATETPWRFKLVLNRLIRPEELEGAQPEQVITVLNKEIEALIRRHPDQYFWLHDRYRDAPLPDEMPVPR